MWTRNPALEADGYPAPATETEEALQMNQDEFHGFYDQIATKVWVFLLHRCGDETLADDLLQETYYRILRRRRVFGSEFHRRNYLFQIASNLANDALRRRRNRGQETSADPEQIMSPALDPTTSTLKRTDLARAMEQLSGRQQEALWLAYAEGSSYEDIAEVLGLRTASIKLLLFRARRKLAVLLGGGAGKDPR